MAGDRNEDRHDFDFGTARKSVVNLIVTVPAERRQLYFKRMEEFSNANGLKLRIGRLKPDYDIFFVDAWRVDTIVTGGNVFDGPEFHFHVYIDPDKGGTAATAETLVGNMKQSLSQIPGVTIKQRK